MNNYIEPSTAGINIQKLWLDYLPFDQFNKVPKGYVCGINDDTFSVSPNNYWADKGGEVALLNYLAEERIPEAYGRITDTEVRVVMKDGREGLMKIPYLQKGN